MLSNFLEKYIKYEINGSVLKFRALNITSMFSLLNEERDFILFLFEGVKTTEGKILEDKKEFTTFIYNKYPTVIKSVIALCYVADLKEKLTFEEKVNAVDNISMVKQLEIFSEITEATFENGVFSDIKKTKAAIEKISKIYNLKK